MRIEPRDMTTIDEAASVAAMAAVISATPVVLEFNGIDLPVDRGALAGDICDAYYRSVRRRERDAADAVKQAKAAEIAKAIMELDGMAIVRRVPGSPERWEADLARVIQRYL